MRRFEKIMIIVILGVVCWLAWTLYMISTSIPEISQPQYKIRSGGASYYVQTIEEKDGCLHTGRHKICGQYVVTELNY